ncbi:MAG TPA: transglutaminase domain-containing protein [Methanothermobacter sp.]|nr:transglutaminase domain-containing protein [Methanothermobacter sp.]
MANFCDRAHLVVALARAAGLSARYVHGILHILQRNLWSCLGANLCEW